MSEIKICKEDKYYSLSIMRCKPFIEGKIRPYKSIWLVSESGEGMEVKSTEGFLYDAIDKFFQEHM